MEALGQGVKVVEGLGEDVPLGDAEPEGDPVPVPPPPPPPPSSSSISPAAGVGVVESVLLRVRAGEEERV